MKKMKLSVANWLFMACLATGAMLSTTSCSSSNDEPDQPTIEETDPAYKNLVHSAQILYDGGKQIGNGDAQFCFTGKQTLKKGVYLIKGWVYLRPGAELTIEPGTVIRGDKETKAALIVEPGAKIHAVGTADAPIVFTSEQKAGSRKPGDWGGVIICGKAPNNNGVMNQQIEGGPLTKHGGTDANDNSGELEYVRIEFAGYPFEKDKEINGLTLGSVGAGTKLDHVQVSYSNDDSFEWFGGTVNCKYLIAYKGWDDDFDTDNGFSGSVQFGLAYRDSRIADASLSNTFESDNNADGTSATPVTRANFANITSIGPKANDPKFVNDEKTYIDGNGEDPQNGSSRGKFQAAAQIRRGSHLNIYNSVLVGWPVGLIIDGEKGNTLTDAQAGKGPVLQNVYMANMTAEGSDKNKNFKDVLYDWKTNSEKEGTVSYSHTYFEAQPGCKYFDDQSVLGLVSISSLLNVVPTASSLAASWSGVDNSWFQKVNYVGAFSGAGDSWINGWTNFDPQNAAYAEPTGAK